MYDLNNLLKQAAEISRTGGASTAEVAGVALALAACRTSIDEMLEPLKKILRDDAREERDDDDPDDVVVEFDGELSNSHQGSGEDTLERAGIVSITFQNRRPRTGKGVSCKKLQRLLGADFDRYFEIQTSVNPRRDFIQTCKDRSKDHPTEVAAAMAEVDLFEPTARVGFRPARSVTPGA